MPGDRYARLPRREAAHMVPRPLSDDGLFEVDATWGHVQPIRLAPGVETVGELELIAHARAGGALVDTRLPTYLSQGTIPGARHVCHEEILDQLDTFDRERPTVFFCNGPQCKATPDAIEQLLGAGFPAAAIRFYRGGIHDWVTLGFPLAPPAA